MKFVQLVISRQQLTIKLFKTIRTEMKNNQLDTDAVITPKYPM
jgi:hypothetical protein